MIDDENNLPFGSRVRFRGVFTKAGKPFDPEGVTATITPPRGQAQIFTQRTGGLFRDGDGVYYVDADMNIVGEMMVRFTSDQGDYQMRRYEVVDDDHRHVEPTAPTPVELPVVVAPRRMTATAQSERRDAWRSPLPGAKHK